MRGGPEGGTPILRRLRSPRFGLYFSRPRTILVRMRLALSFVLVAGCGLGLTITKATDEGPDSREVGVGDSAVPVETCDGEDNDGDGEIDEGYDVDGDGYTSCGSVEADPDCDDADASVNPGATETAGNEVDDDCDGVVDSGTWRSGDLLLPPHH